MGLMWWLWLGAGAVIAIGFVASGAHWAAVDLVLDRFGSHEPPESEPALPHG